MNHILNVLFECKNNEEKLLLGKGASVIFAHDEKTQSDMVCKGKGAILDIFSPERTGFCKDCLRPQVFFPSSSPSSLKEEGEMPKVCLNTLEK